MQKELEEQERRRQHELQRAQQEQELRAQEQLRALQEVHEEELRALQQEARQEQQEQWNETPRQDYYITIYSTVAILLYCCNTTSLAYFVTDDYITVSLYD